MVVRPLAVTGTTMPTRSGAPRRRLGVGLLVGQEGGEAGDRGRRALAHERDGHGVDALHSRRRAAGSPTSWCARRPRRCRPRWRGHWRSTLGTTVTQVAAARPPAASLTGMPVSRSSGVPERRARDRLLQIGAVHHPPVEGDADRQAARRPGARGHADQEVEPGLIGRHPRGLGGQHERRAGSSGACSAAPAPPRSQRADQGGDSHCERAQGGPGAARRHRQRVEGALPWAGAVHVGA